MIIKHRSFRDHVWTVFAFPKRNISLLWDDTTKTYEFFKGIPHSNEKDFTPYQVKKIVRDKDDNIKKIVQGKDDNIEYWKRVCWVLSGTLGVTLAVLLFRYL